MAYAGQTMKPIVSMGRHADDCWEWLSVKTNGGYGKKTVNGRTVLAHRWIWEQLFGPIRRGYVIDHTCMNPGCINPAHLEMVTQAENCRRSITTKLTNEDALEIKRSRGICKRDTLARRYGVSPQLVSDIWYGRAWTKAKYIKTKPTGVETK